MLGTIIFKIIMISHLLVQYTTYYVHKHNSIYIKNIFSMIKIQLFIITSPGPGVFGWCGIRRDEQAARRRRGEVSAHQRARPGTQGASAGRRVLR